MPGKKITLTIVIPAYDEERYITKCLDSIARQTMVPYEVIVVDNNSTDQTVEIAKHYSFVKVISEPMQGITFARNRGFNEAAGEFIGRIDADTILPANWVDAVTAFYSQPNNAKNILTGGCRFYNLHTGRLTAWFYNLTVYRINRVLLGFYFPWGSNSALPAAAWRDVRSKVTNRADIHEDLDLGIHLERAGYRTTYLKKLRVGAVAKRILTDRGDLWHWLTMWPRTYKLNGIRSWPLIFPFVLAVWLGRYWIFFSEAIADIFRPKLR